MTTATTILSSTKTEKIAHVWEDSQWWAIRAARAANRPLLIRGEPGIGKTQLAYAAAKVLERRIIPFTVDSTTEARDLMWSFDAVTRLAEAQVAAHLCKDDLQELKKKMNLQRFVKPGPLWYAINWDSAVDHLKTIEQTPPPLPPDLLNWQESDGVVILIDEIDKANSDVPNGLLEVFGMRQFTPQGWETPITANSQVKPPLIVITTNEERALPDPFVRRCVVLQLKLPDCTSAEGNELRNQEKQDKEQQEVFLQYLIARGKAHFERSIPEAQLRLAAELLLKDRLQAIRKNQRLKPGQAEYLDFLRAMTVLAAEEKNKNQEGDTDEVIYKRISDNIQKFLFEKSAGVEQ